MAQQHSALRPQTKLPDRNYGSSAPRAPVFSDRGNAVDHRGPAARDRIMAGIRGAPHARLHALFESQSNGIAIFNSAGWLVDANPAAERILNLSRAQLFDLSIRDPRFRMPGSATAPSRQGDHPILVALKTHAEVRGRVMGLFHPETNTTSWMAVDAVPYLTFGEPPQWEAFAYFTAVEEPDHADAAPALEDADKIGATDAMAQLATLSTRQRQILDAVMHGDSNKQIAYNLGISPRTVEVHRTRILAKLKVRKSALAIRIAATAAFAIDRNP